MIETGLVSFLNSQSSVTALVGSSIQPIPAPEDLTDYPVITYQVASYGTSYTLQSPTGVAQKRIIFDCWATTYLQAQQIWEALRATLTGFTGALPDGTEVLLIKLVNGQDYFESESRIYRATLHALIQYQESTGS